MQIAEDCAFFGSTGKCISKLQEGYYLKNTLQHELDTMTLCQTHSDGDTNVC